jgi:hypothetical protein
MSDTGSDAVKAVGKLRMLAMAGAIVALGALMSAAGCATGARHWGDDGSGVGPRYGYTDPAMADWLYTHGGIIRCRQR